MSAAGIEQAPDRIGHSAAGIGHSAARVIAVDVVDPDLAADVRAVLAALALDTAAAGAAHADALVTDGADGGGLPGRRRVVRVGSDRDPDDDDEVIRLPSGTGELVSALMAPVPTRSGSLVVVHGAVGGCGASTLSAAMAVRAASSTRTLLVEADPHGTGVDLLLGIESVPGLRVEDVRADLGGPDPDALWGAVPSALPGLGVLARSRNRDARGSAEGAVTDTATGPPTGQAFGTAPGATAARDGAPGAMYAHREAGGLVVSDAGGLIEAGDWSAGADLVVVVTRADLQGAVAAGRAVRDFPGVVLVVRTGRGDPLDAVDVAQSAGAASWYVLPEIGPVRRVVGAGELGPALNRGRAGRVRRLAEVADAVLGEAGLDA